MFPLRYFDPWSFVKSVVGAFFSLCLLCLLWLIPPNSFPMALKKISQVCGRAVYFPGDDIDTDQIIPARFLRCITFDGLGEFLFYDVRKEAKGRGRPHPLDDSRFAGASIMICGNNFGCGSSREHAPQAISKAGFAAIIAEGFAEIFFGNSATLGLPCLSASRDDIQSIADAVEADPSIKIRVDVANGEIRYGDTIVPCHLPDAAREGFISGTWDPIAELLAGDSAIDDKARSLPYV